MTKGVLLFANNNAQIDYVKQAIYCAKRVKKHLDLPVTLVTENATYANTAFPFYKKYIDNIIEVKQTTNIQTKRYRDGVYAQKSLEWKNLSRADCYDLTPYDETIVMDTDFLIANNQLLQCFNYNDEFLINKEFKDAGYKRTLSHFDKISDRSIEMFWATVFYFKKTTTTEVFFKLVKHIRDNWNYYRLIYQIPNKNFRNDFAFSIAIHILNGNKKGSWPNSLPGHLYMSLDIDILDNVNNDKFVVLCDQAENGQYLAVGLTEKSLHVMNKFSLNRIIDKEFESE
jgi:ribulose bisphosphate carboxylase small subunit